MDAAVPRRPYRVGPLDNENFAPTGTLPALVIASSKQCVSLSAVGPVPVGVAPAGSGGSTVARHAT